MTAELTMPQTNK